MRELGVEQLEDLARGAAILGTGGGGDPYVGMLLARSAIERNGPVTVFDIDEVPADANVLAISGIGAPTVLLEKLPRGTEELAALCAYERYTGISATHIVPIEIGGINSMLPIALAAERGLPLVDGDAMGRAFPEAQMVLPNLAGIPITPIALADDKGNTFVVDTVDSHTAERIARGACTELGGQISAADTLMRGDQLEQALVPASLSLAEQLGAAVREARRGETDPVESACALLSAKVLLHGKVTDIARNTSGGFVRGQAILEGPETQLRLEFQNEHLLARIDDRIVATAPDLICVLDSETGEPVTTEGMRYGLRVTALVAPCDPRWRSPAGLELVGPRYFGYETDYLPFERAGV